MRLLGAQELESHEWEPWQTYAFESFKNKLTDRKNPFPCIPAVQGLSLGHLRFVFVDKPNDALDQKKLAKILKDYSLGYKEYGKYTSLIIFFNYVGSFDIKDYEKLFWDQLTLLHRLDESSWPRHISPDPEHPTWEFCFQDVPYFVYCATPEHRHRKSRSFPFMLLALTPRSVFNEFRANEKHAEKIKAQTRKRLAAYDEVPIHPSLNTYGKNDNFEWKQYFLPDDQGVQGKCPFKHKW